MAQPRRWQGEDGSLRCSRCRKVKPESEFHRDACKQTTGRYSWCKDCTRSKMAVPASRRQQRAGQLRRKFNMTLDDYADLVVEQGGVCAICRKPPSDKALAVDHDHRTGLIRGALCFNCNHNLLGVFHDNAELFESAADYLRNPPSNRAFDAPKYHPDAPPSHGD